MSIKKNNEPLKVKRAVYLDGFRVSIFFNDGFNKIVDFSNFINSNNSYYTQKYKSTSNFKKFKVENGNIVWGDNWDLIFPVNHLRSGKISV